jgi:predicted transcriptional regulator of viral defense system
MPAGRPDIRAEAVRLRLRREGRTTLDVARDRAWLAEITPHYHELLSNMTRSGLAHRLQRGRYVINVEDKVPSEAPLLDSLEPLANTLLDQLGVPYYLSWHTALFHYGLLEQQASTIYCAVPTRKRTADFYGFKVKFVALNRSRFFGIEPASGYAGTVRIATVEKSLLDALERPELTAPFPIIVRAFEEAASGGMLDPKRLVAYTIETAKPALTRRVGFLMERYGVEGAEALHPHIGGDYLVPLRTAGPRREGRPDRRWRVRVSDSQLATAEQPR